MTLAAIIVWLTIEYAPGAAARAKMPYGESDDGSIDPVWGHVTIALMTIATLTAGFEPIIAKRADRWWRRNGKRWWNSLDTSAKWAFFMPIALILVPAKFASFVCSLIDFILARPIAILAGAAWRGWKRRYAHFAGLMMLAVVAVAAVETGLLPSAAALTAIVAGLVAILAIVRRWSWIESDRNTFLIERGEREEGKGTLRIGFKEDLRDEALTALACLFFLIPLGLDLVQQTTSAAGVPAFAFNNEEPMPRETIARFITWLGYFGAELAKTVPFVDWSEVFHVANGSPINAQTALGSQLAFVMRASLDLLFLAAVLQAVQIATRLREQRSAFDNNRLPILEPFTERIELARASEQINDDLDLRPSAQPVILDFPRYDATRLKELIDGTAETKDLGVRKSAAALLQKDYEGAPESNSKTAHFWTEQVKAEVDDGYRNWLLNVVSGADPDEPARMRDAARRARLLRIVDEEWNDVRVRSQAVRQLGRLDLRAQERDVLMRGLLRDNELSVRAAAAVALAKANAEEAFPAIETLISSVPQDAVVPSQTLAYSLAHQGLTAEDIASRFCQELAPHVMAAALIQRAPLEIVDARSANPLGPRVQTVAITPGTDGFPATFDMGSSDQDSHALESEKPKRRAVTMTRPFAMGCFTVTVAEYSAFIKATGRKRLRTDEGDLLPAVEVTWFDACAYCRWLEEITGNAWRLPTEAEWEYACRAGTETAFSWGDWEQEKAHSNQTEATAARNVGSYAPNSWGLWDMHGNVWEWCLDPWHDTYKEAPLDQSNWLFGGDFSRRVVRGGAWISTWHILRSAHRASIDPTYTGAGTGFRITRTL
ncbi:SUMF1/EgtB/PvdO family nonheme iron enzyme [uncultured Hyphomonas sp.]|uniref:formylglycine-generating enzyme family protein n=1 Tax=uncultured Hyphomonas sp. TaxID=225298 RepID=UPI002AAC2D3D|nr:SUMF1/EgtB/PvdO family nonheme iron enzyme [uncultured Hyphomonas sp.]